MQSSAALSERTDIAPAKPILKWAGGKGQMLGEIVPRVPKKYNKYIEPFCGGAEPFFPFRRYVRKTIGGRYEFAVGFQLGWKVQ